MKITKNTKKKALQFGKPGNKEISNYKAGDVTALPLHYSVKETELPVSRKHYGHTETVLL
jgi:hypothetical protein